MRVGTRVEAQVKGPFGALSEAAGRVDAVMGNMVLVFGTWLSASSVEVGATFMARLAGSSHTFTVTRVGDEEVEAYKVPRGAAKALAADIAAGNYDAELDEFAAAEAAGKDRATIRNAIAARKAVLDG
jgi:hypothetical protein